MASPPSLVHIAFAAGLDESQHEEVLDPMRAFTLLQNVRQDHRGGLTKRLGFGALPLTRLSGSRSAGRRLFAHHGIPTVIDGTHIDSYVETGNTNVTRSRVPECSDRTITLPTPASSAVLYDTEYCNGYVAVVYGATLNGTCKAAIVEAETGAIVRSPETIGAAAGRAFVTAFGSRYFVAFVRQDSATTITAHLLDTQALASGWTSLATVAATSASATPAVCSLADRVAIVYGIASGTDRVVVKTYNAAGLAETKNIGTSSATPAALAIAGSVAGTLWVAWEQADSINAIGLDADALSTTLATQATVLTVPGVQITKDIGICEGSTAGTARAWVLSDETPATMRMVGITTTGGATTPGSSTTVYGVRPTSRPFQVNGRYYMACALAAEHHDLTVLGANRQNLCVIVDWTDDVAYFRPIANVEPGLVVSAVPNAKAASVGNGKWVLGYQVTVRGEASIGSVIVGDATLRTSMVELDFMSRHRWPTADHANSTFLGGAVLSVYDGERVTEAGFLCRPTAPTTSLSSNGITGTYRYVATYEDVDAAGNWVVSGISTPSSTASPSDQTVTVTTQTLTVSSRIAKGTTRVVFYRTDSGAEPPYYRLAAVDNDTSAATVSYADSTEDVTSNAQLYAPNLPGAAGESLDRRAPPGLLHLVSYAGMLVGARGESLFYSGQEVSGEATWFSPVFESPITGGGSITGLCAQDGALVVFKEDAVFVVSGDAPNDNGLAGGLGTPRLIASDVGCVEPSSIVATSLGIFFRSVRGIELLTRAQTVEPIGEAIQDTLASFPVVTSAVLDGRNSVVRFSLAESEEDGAVSGEGRDVVFDLSLKVWISVDDKTGDDAHAPSQSAAMVYVDGAWRYAWLSADTGRVYTERSADDEFAHFDDSEWIEMAAETGWFKLAGLQGRQQLNCVLLLARKHTDHGISISLAYDYEQNFRTATGWAWDTINDLLTAGWPITQLKHAPHNDAECQAFRVRVEDVAVSVGENPPYPTPGSQKGSTWLGLTLDITPKPGVFDVPEEAA